MPADCAVAEPGHPHTASGTAHTEVAADVEEARLCVGSAVGGEHHFGCLTEQGLQLAFQFLVGDGHPEFLRDERTFSVSHLTEGRVADETGRHCGNCQCT